METKMAHAQTVTALDWWTGSRGDLFADSLSRRYCVSRQADESYQVTMNDGVSVGKAASLDSAKDLAQAHSERW
jgi:hypothetical protein